MKIYLSLHIIHTFCSSSSNWPTCCTWESIGLPVSNLITVLLTHLCAFVYSLMTGQIMWAAYKIHANHLFRLLTSEFLKQIVWIVLLRFVFACSYLCMDAEHHPSQPARAKLAQRIKIYHYNVKKFTRQLWQMKPATVNTISSKPLRRVHSSSWFQIL